MTEPVTAILSPDEPVQRWEAPEIADPETVARFDNVFSGESFSVSPVEGELIVDSPNSIGDSMLQHLMGIDSNHQRFFSRGTDSNSLAKLATDDRTSVTTTTNVVGEENSSFGVNSMEEFTAMHIDRIFWLAELDFTMSMGETVSGVTKTLLTNGGG